MMFEAQEELAAIKYTDFLGEATAASTKSTVNAIHLARWDYIFTDTMAAGYMLDPEFRDVKDKQFDTEIQDGYLAMVDRTYPMPDALPEDVNDSETAAHAKATAKATNRRAACASQLTAYADKRGILSRPEVEQTAKQMAA